MKFPFLPQNPIASIYRMRGISDWKRVYPYIEPKTTDRTIRKILRMAWDDEFKVRPGTTPLELETLLENIKASHNIDGDIIEFGTYKGGTAIYLAKYLDSIKDDRKLYMCDTFEGFPYEDEHSKNINLRKGYLSDTNEIEILKLFKKNKLMGNANIIKGKFEETLFQELDDKTFSFAFIDCDLYQSGIIALDFISKHIQKNGIICIHDYETKWGINKAIKDFEKKSTKCHIKDVVENMAIMTVEE